MEQQDESGVKRTVWGTWTHHQPIFKEEERRWEYVTLCVEIGSIERFPDRVMMWTVPHSEWVRRPQSFKRIKAPKSTNGI
jgi:hypothetical protein